MREYFIYATSFGAPLFSDITERHVEAESAQSAVGKFMAGYTHPRGLYAAVCYASADAMKQGTKPLAKWLCNQEIEKIRLTANLHGYGFYSPQPGVMEINGVRHTVANPKQGAFVEP